MAPKDNFSIIVCSEFEVSNSSLPPPSDLSLDLLPSYQDYARIQDKPKIFFCLPCEEENREKKFSSSITSNFKRHLETNHQITTSRIYTKKKPISYSSSSLPIHSTQNPTQNPSQTAETLDKISDLVERLKSTGGFQQFKDRYQLEFLPSKEETERNLIRLISTQNLPFSAVEWEPLRYHISLYNQFSQLPTRQTIKTKIYQFWLDSKDTIRKQLQSALSTIHLSLDIWTSPNRLLFLGICAHYIDRDQENIKNILLDITCTTGHSGEDQFKTLQPILEEYNISYKIGTIIRDNSSTNNTLCQEIQKYFCSQGMIK